MLSPPHDAFFTLKLSGFKHLPFVPVKGQIFEFPELAGESDKLVVENSPFFKVSKFIITDSTTGSPQGWFCCGEHGNDEGPDAHITVWLKQSGPICLSAEEGGLSDFLNDFGDRGFPWLVNTIRCHPRVLDYLPELKTWCDENPDVLVQFKTTLQEITMPPKKKKRRKPPEQKE